MAKLILDEHSYSKMFDSLHIDPDLIVSSCRRPVE